MFANIRSSNIGRVHFGAVQGATSFASSFPHIFGIDEPRTNKIPCLIPCAIDQDPYFRVTRDVAPRLHFAKPSLIHSRFLDALQGPGSKMSASIDTSAIFLKDTPAQIKNKINKYAFSGGQFSEAEQREKGGNTEVDVSYQWLTFFLEDDAELASIKEAYETGKMLTGELKAICAKEISKFVLEFQERRGKVDESVVDEFMAVRPLEWRGNPDGPDPSKAAETAAASAAAKLAPVALNPDGTPKLTKNQEKKLLKEKANAEKKAALAAEKAAKRAAAEANAA